MALSATRWPIEYNKPSVDFPPRPNTRPILNPEARSSFDEVFEQVLEELPPIIHELIEKVPLLVEDYPSQSVLQRTGIHDRRQLCGLYTGIPLTERSVWHSGTLPDVVTIYREGIISCAVDRVGHVDMSRLREEIRITILHELAHHHGLDEDELRRLGYG
jgi:predicted Zn-dependent protease with MMP-like domain